MRDKLASCENLVLELWKIPERKSPEITSHGVQHSIRLIEIPLKYAEDVGEA